MSYRDQLETEITKHIDALMADGKPLHATWITHAICNDHDGGLSRNAHADFWRHGGYLTCRDMTRRIINGYAGDREDGSDREPMFPGFDHVQPYYMVRRNGDHIGVSALHLTDDEIDAKADVYRKMGEACFAHADELVRFKVWRMVAVAG